MSNDINKNTIMLIEDNQDDYEALERAFKKLGDNYEIQWLKHSSEVMELFTNSDEFFTVPQIILLDLNLPGIDGRKVLQHMRESKLVGAVPIVILTTSNNEKDVKFCYENGANSYIQKPLNFEKYIEMCSSLSKYWFETCVLTNYDPT